MILSLTILNSIIFFIYGSLCIFNEHMVDEFKEFNLSKYRIMTGILEICGALGSLIGYFWYSPLYIFSTTGLAVLMFLGVYTRIRVKQPLQKSTQAFSLFLLNTFLSYEKFVKDFF